MILQLTTPDNNRSYSSASQNVRVLSEAWADKYLYCLNCGVAHIQKTRNNSPVADFICPSCAEEYELKSKNGHFSTRITDGAYATMIERIQSTNNPNFIFLHYQKAGLAVRDLFAIPRRFFFPDMIVARKPLSLTARRAGWQGCNIDTSRIPESGKIFVVRGGIEVPKKSVINLWKQTAFLNERRQLPDRGWIIDVMRCIDRLDGNHFTLQQMYAFADELKRLHPTNEHVNDKIRQQLQFLRDAGYVKFLGNGNYAKS